MNVAVADGDHGGDAEVQGRYILDVPVLVNGIIVMTYPGVLDLALPYSGKVPNARTPMSET